MWGRRQFLLVFFGREFGFGVGMLFFLDRGGEGLFYEDGEAGGKGLGNVT